MTALLHYHQPAVPVPPCCVAKVLLKVDLTREDIPGGEDFVGVLLTLANLGIPVRHTQ